MGAIQGNKCINLWTGRGLSRVKQGKHTLLSDVLDKTMPKDTRKPEQQSSTSAKRWGDKKKQIFFPILFSFSA